MVCYMWESSSIIGVLNGGGICLLNLFVTTAGIFRQNQVDTMNFREVVDSWIVCAYCSICSKIGLINYMTA